MKKNALSILALLLLASSLTLSTFPTARAAHAPITIDGDPADWTGTPGATNTWVYDDTAEEWIWNDEVGDDKGNGTYTYPTAWIMDDGVNKSAFTGSDADLTELRIAWNDSHVFFLLTFDNITNHISWLIEGGWLSDPVQADTTAVFICIDTDHEPESGYWEVDALDASLNPGGIWAEINLTSTGWWEYLFEICLADVVLWRWDSDFGAVATATREIPIAANVDDGYEAIEAAVPIDATGIEGLPDPEGTDWCFFCFIGLQDMEHIREVNAATSGWNGGGGTDHEADPDAYDCAFFATKADQEAALNDFSEEPDPDGTYCVISTCKQIPEFPLPLGFALIAIVVLVASFKMRKKLYT